MTKGQHSSFVNLPQIATIALGLLCSTMGSIAQANYGDDASWVLVSDALEACLLEEEKSMTTGHACIGKHARRCLAIAEREPLVHVEKCYEPEVAAWARLVKRYFAERPKDAMGKRLADVQRVWLAYRDAKCGYNALHHGGGDLGRWQSMICLMEETGRRAIELRALRIRPSSPQSIQP